MPFNLGPGELFLLGIAALLIFGPKKLPEIGRSLGEALGSLKKAYNSAATLDSAKPAETAVQNQAAPPPPASAASAENAAPPAAASAATAASPVPAAESRVSVSKAPEADNA